MDIDCCCMDFWLIALNLLILWMSIYKIKLSVSQIAVCDKNFCRSLRDIYLSNEGFSFHHCRNGKYKLECKEREVS